MRFIAPVLMYVSFLHEVGELVSLDIPYTADAILATFHPMFYRFQRQERGFSSERILQGLRRIYIEGVKMPRSEE